MIRKMTEELSEVLGKFHGKKVLVVGDAGLDRYIHCLSTRLCPEAPVPVVSCQRDEYRPGLAANVAANVATLGGEVRLCTLIGDDQTGFDLCDALDQAKVKDIEEFVGKVPNRTTTLKNRFYVSRQMLLRLDQEDTTEFEEVFQKRFTQEVCNQIRTWAEVVVIQDYAKGLITRELVHEMVKASADSKIKIIVDPSPKTYPTVYSGCHYLKPNQSELEAMCNHFKYSTAATYAYDQLADVLGCQGIVVTQGDKGIFVEDRDVKEEIPAYKKEVFDVCGAGDTVSAALALGIASGLSVFHSAQIANAAASIVVGKFGTATVTWDELLKTLQEANHGSRN